VIEDDDDVVLYWWAGGIILYANELSLYVSSHLVSVVPPLNFFLAQGNLAFGSKGRPASAGKPRIPANAEIVFEVEMVGLPGKEPELIELIGDV